MQRSLTVVQRTHRSGGAGPRTPGRGARGLIVTLLVAGLLPLPAGASSRSGGEADPQVAEVRAARDWIPPLIGTALGRALWFWPERERAYQLRATSATWDKLVAYDSSSMSEVAVTTLSPPAWGDGGSNEYYSGAGRHHVATVDRAGGRVFVAYRSSISRETANAAEQVCGRHGVSPDPGCVGGLHVLDGATLDHLGRIPVNPPTVDGVRLQPIPRALEYAPAQPERGWGGKVLMVVEELIANPTEDSIVGTTVSPAYSTAQRRNGNNVAFAIQFDPETMRQEWAVRLEGCRNARTGRNWSKEEEGHPSAIFRAGGDDPALYVGCHGNAAQQGVVVRVPLDEDGVPANLPVDLRDPVDSDAVFDGGSDPESASGTVQPDESALPVTAAPRQEAFPGPEKVSVVLADAESRRVLMRVDDAGEVWWVFDADANQYIGTIGIGDYNHGHTTYALDPDTGRLYVLAAEPTNTRGPGGLYLADVRRNPLAQALHYPELADPPRAGNSPAAITESSVGRVMSVEPRAGRGVARIFQTVAESDAERFRVIEDRSEVSVDDVRPGAVVRTLDLDEAEDVTTATFDGTARGFGFRTILLGGVEGATRVGPADPLGLARGLPDLHYEGAAIGVGDPDRECGEVTVGPTKVPDPCLALRVGSQEVSTVSGLLPRPDPCADAQRELILAFAGPESPAVVDASSSRGETQPVVADVRTREDLAAPASRCAPVGWEELWQTALFSQAPTEEPNVDWPFEDSRSSCTTTDQHTSDAWSDSILGAFASEVECSENEVQGWGQARGADLDGVSVAHALSSFRIYRDPRRGMVARVESIARGIDIGGMVKIDAVRGLAESWANGRHLSEEAEPADDDVFNPFNCDRTRPAGTCFQRQVVGVTAMNPDGGVAYRCGPCGPEEELLDAMNRAFGSYGSARFREPNRDLARGSADGYMAAITKKDKERFADIVLNADLLETMVPMLEVVRYAPHGRQSTQSGGSEVSMGTPPKGRQVYQFAAVEVSSTYSIQCLLIYDAATNTCAAAKEQPGSITVTLADPEGHPLAGGAFEVRADTDGDGVLGLVDELVGDGACVTAEDGIGSCVFDGLMPGGYLVSQVAAPPGYGIVEEPWLSDVLPGEARTVTFTNVSNLSAVDVTATDAGGRPVAGAEFAVFADPDADGKVAPDAEPVATCTTGADGTCTMRVPAGSYVLVQLVAPAGLEPIEPVAFAFAAGGQVAAVGAVNRPPAPPEARPAAGPAVDYTPSAPARPPVETVELFQPPAEDAVQPAPLPQAVGDTVVQIIRAPGDAVRLLARDPQQAVAWVASVALFCVAGLAVRRRQRAMALIEQ